MKIDKMPCRLLGVLILLLVPVCLIWAQGEVVLMSVGSDSIGWAECNSRFHSSKGKKWDVFLKDYAHLKQKVLYAKELGLDTVPSFCRKRDYYKKMFQIQSLKKHRKGTPSSNRTWIKLFHVTYPLMQHADKMEIQKGLEYLKCLYAEGRGGEKWRKYSKELPWLQTRHLLKEWSDELDKLNSNELSKPFLSPMGIHVVMWTDKKMGVPADVDECFRIQEIEEDLLLLELEEYLQHSLVCSEQELESFFREHRSDYGWGIPHFRGVVMHCQNKREAKAIKKYLKQFPEILWQDACERMPVEIAKKCKVEYGLFAIGTNVYVDKLAFNCGEFEPLKDYPYTWVYGKKLKKGPESYRDVSERMKLDCWLAKKKRQMMDLDRKYKVEINEEVLKTVNHAINK